MLSYLKSERFLRGFTWISALVLVAGLVAAGSVWLGRGDAGADASAPENAPPAVKLETEPGTVFPTNQEEASKRVPRQARVVAGEFILAAAGRENLRKAWQLSHPTLRRECACTYKQWLTGNIPVPYYPVDDLDLASFGVSEIGPETVVLEVVLVPKDSSELKPQVFFIGLKARTAGGKKQWLVDYFAPYATPPVPAEASG